MANVPDASTPRPVHGLPGVFELTLPLPCLPCAFCGGTRLVVQATDRYGNSQWGELEAWAFQVRCTSCSAQGPWNKTGAESACRQWNQRSIHGLDLAQLVVEPANRTTCPDCGRRPLLLAPRAEDFRLLGSEPFFWLCVCGAIRQTGNPEPIAPSRYPKPPAALETGLRITDHGLVDNVVEPHGARVPPPNYGDLDAETEAIDGDQVV